MRYDLAVTRTDRRRLIADAALDLAATGGNHAITHQTIDRHLELPKGSTSYYFRTRGALVGAAAERLVARSREAFASHLAKHGETPVDVIAGYLLDLTVGRRSDVLARQALLLDPTVSAVTRERLLGCLFSTESARSLMTASGSSSPDRDAERLLMLLEGIAFTLTHRGIDARTGKAEIRAQLGAAFPELV
ncbi:TetR family transcriptional regulator [Gordonia araii NBRC 100433]|nr:TetR family transcriptional regulator [Gordonia araii NBRC 100433]